MRVGLIQSAEGLNRLLLLLSRFGRVWLCATGPHRWQPTGSSVPGILQARTLEWVSMPSSKGSSPLSVQAHVSCITDGFFTADCQGNHIYIYIYIHTLWEREVSWWFCLCDFCWCSLKARALLSPCPNTRHNTRRRSVLRRPAPGVFYCPSYLASRALWLRLCHQLSHLGADPGLLYHQYMILFEPFNLFEPQFTCLQDEGDNPFLPGLVWGSLEVMCVKGSPGACPEPRTH